MNTVVDNIMRVLLGVGIGWLSFFFVAGIIFHNHISTWLFTRRNSILISLEIIIVGSMIYVFGHLRLVIDRFVLWFGDSSAIVALIVLVIVVLVIFFLIIRKLQESYDQIKSQY